MAGCHSRRAGRRIRRPGENLDGRNDVFCPSRFWVVCTRPKDCFPADKSFKTCLETCPLETCPSDMFDVKEIPILVEYSEYEKALTTDSMINVTAVCQVEGWGDLMVEGIVTLKKPNLKVQTTGQAEVGKSTTIEVKFTNPLQFPVNNCVLTAEGSGLIEHEVKKSVGTLEPGKTMTVTMDIKPFASGHKHLLLNFSSDRFKDIKEFIALSVSELAS